MGSEVLPPADIDNLVQSNKELMEKMGRHFGANRVELDSIFLWRADVYATTCS
jgi:hypothetical protein